MWPAMGLVVSGPKSERERGGEGEIERGERRREGKKRRKEKGKEGGRGGNERRRRRR